MALWMQILGIRKMGSIKNEREQFLEILNKLELDFEFLDEKYFDKRYNRDIWTLKKRGQSEYLEYSFNKNNEQEGLNMNSVRISYSNPDFIDFLGPEHYFYSWGHFTNKENEKSTEGWRTFFFKIAKEYGLSELIYSSEWAFPVEMVYEGDETFKNLSKIFNDNPELEKKELYNLMTNEYYIEKINPIANAV